jgi:hypothetical protein
MLRSGARLSGLAAMVALANVALAVPATGHVATATPPAVCISDNGTDVQRYFDIEGRDVIWPNIQGVSPPCLTVVQGRTFYRAHGWIAQLAPRAVYPDGYEPNFRVPMLDFLSKLTEARYEISDSDGRVEITRTVRRPALLVHAHFGRFGDLFVAPDTTLVPGVTIGGRAPEWTTLEPFDSRSLDIGDHTIEIYWTLSEQRCDGFAPDPVNNCLPAGESLTTRTTFAVVGA